VVIADDAAIVREGLASVLAKGGFEVVGLAGDANEPSPTPHNPTRTSSTSPP
jgi:DNA-binding NarL/FixJ family response regulator